MLSSYMQPGGGLLKPKHVHAAGFYTSEIQVVFSRYSEWFYCLLTQQDEITLTFQNLFSLHSKWVKKYYEYHLFHLKPTHALFLKHTHIHI